MDKLRFNQTFIRQMLATAMVALMIFAAIPTWPGAGRATASSNIETEILKAFDELQAHITKLPAASFSAAVRNSLSAKLKDARTAFSAKDPCAGAKFLEAMVADSRALRSGARVAIAEDLSNRVSSLRHDLLSMRPEGKTCDNAPRANQTPEVEIAASDNKHLRGVVKFGEPKMWTVKAEGEQFTEMEIPGVQQGVGEPGIPSVPVMYRLVAVPQGAKARVSVKTGNAQSMKVNLYPIQPEAQDRAQKNDELKIPADRFKEPEFTKNKDVYSTDALFPNEVCVVTPLGKARDLQLVQLAIAAGQYNPKSQQLTLFESVEFEVIFEGGNGAFITTDAINQFESATSSLVNSVINRKEVFKFVIEGNRKLICGGEEFLILTHPDFRDAAVRLAEWKRDKGITTTVVNVNDGNGNGPDTKEEIDAFIEGRFNWCGVRPSYVLLLGDAEFIEPFYVNTSGSSTTGTDYPYALLSGEGDDVPDFALGRIPVDTLEQANTVVDKIINYESNPPGQLSFYRNVGIASQFQCCRSGGQQGRDLRSFIETSELVRNELLNRGYGVDRIYTKTVEGNGGSTPRRFYNGALLPEELDANSGFAWDGDTNDIVNAWNAGRFLFLHRDHGWEDGWAHPGFTTTNVNNDLNNGELLPVVFSVNCASGLFDNETANGDYGTTVNREYFAERLLRTPNGGAVGILGDTRNSPTWANSALTRGFFDAVWANTVTDFGDNTRYKRLGDILNYGKLYLITQIGVAGTTEAPTEWNVTSELYMWHVLGDPTLEMWTRRPLNALPWGFAAQWANAFSLKVKYAAENATITAFQQTRNGVVHVGRGKVRNGEAILTVVQRPIANEPIQFIASAENEVSINLTRKARY
jgi:hypothetical protein